MPGIFRPAASKTSHFFFSQIDHNKVTLKSAHENRPAIRSALPSQAWGIKVGVYNSSVIQVNTDEAAFQG